MPRTEDVVRVLRGGDSASSAVSEEDVAAALESVMLSPQLLSTEPLVLLPWLGAGVPAALRHRALSAARACVHVVPVRTLAADAVVRIAHALLTEGGDDDVRALAPALLARTLHETQSTADPDAAAPSGALSHDAATIVVPAFMQCVLDSALEVAGVVLGTLPKWASDGFLLGPGVHVSRSIAAWIREQWASVDDTNRLRLGEIVVSVAAQSDAALMWCEEHDVLAPVLQLARTDDLLVEMNAVALLVPLARTVHGARYLVQHGAVDALVKRASPESDALDLVRVPAVGVLDALVQQPRDVWHALESRVDFAGLAFALAERGSAEVLEHVLLLLASLFRAGALGDVGSSSAQRAVALVGESLGRQASRVAALHTLARLVECARGEARDAAPEWRDALWRALPLGRHAGSSAVADVLQFLAAPDDAVIKGALDVLRAMATTVWGVRTLFGEARFFEWLRDRSLLSAKWVHEWKFAIVQAIAQHEHLTQLIGTFAHTQVLLYLKQGPFFVERDVAVAVGEHQ